MKVYVVVLEEYGIGEYDILRVFEKRKDAEKYAEKQAKHYCVEDGGRRFRVFSTAFKKAKQAGAKP